MALIQIHVSPLTKRWLDSLYGPGQPYRIRRSDVFYHYLTMDPLLQDENAVIRYHKTLRHLVSISVSENMKRRLSYKNRAVTVGYSIHKALQGLMMTFMEAQVLAEVPAQAALKSFFERYGVEEDDYCLDSAYTAWKRHQDKFYKERVVFRAGSVREFDPRKWRKTGAGEASLPDDKSWVIHSVNDHFECGLVNLLCRDMKDRSFQYVYDEELASGYAYERQVLSYLLQKDAGLSYAAIARVVNRHESNIRRGAQGVEMMVKTKFEAALYDIAEIRKLIAARRPKQLE